MHATKKRHINDLTDNKMKKALLATVIGLSIIACPVLYFLVGPALNAEQIDVLKILVTITACSGLYCFVVGELTRNNSQMDKLWSILPEIYVWMIAIKGGMTPRLVTMAVLATLWGARLTFNFARKGAYSIKFWAGTEDYRWVLLRSRKEFQPRWKWAIFDLFFISTYQNLLVLMTTFPALVVMNSDKPFGIVDCLAAVLMLGFICYEATADVQQWKFQSTKWGMIKSGKKLEELPAPYNKGFNTSGLWRLSRHPNYFGEQGTWVALYIFSIGAGIGVFNWSIIGALLLIVLFQGSSFFGEWLSSQKYPEYATYCKSINKFFPGKPYQPKE